jgi:hypothetical protein
MVNIPPVNTVRGACCCSRLLRRRSCVGLGTPSSPFHLWRLLVAFIIREPLVVLARQRWVWRDTQPETAVAKRVLAWEIPLLLACGVFLWTSLPKVPLAALAAMGLIMTGAAVWMTLKNRQRSTALQIVSAFGLSSGAFLGALAGVHELPPWVWALWLVLSLHSFVGVLVVHARLELRIRTSKELHPSTALRVAYVAVGILVVPAIWAASTWSYALAGAIAISIMVHLIELYQLGRDEAMRERLQRVGLRILGTSLLHSALTVAALW